MASAPAPLLPADPGATVPSPPSLKAALLIIGGLLLFVVATIVLVRYLIRRRAWEAEGGAAGREQVEAETETASRIAAARREQVEAGATRRITAAGREAAAGAATPARRITAARIEEVGVAVETEAGVDDGMERLIASLPLFTMASALAAVPKNSPDCAVCLSPFEPDAALRLLPACRHAFHAACVDAWLRTNPVCPICRSGVSLPLPPLPAAAASASAAGQEPPPLDSLATSLGDRESFRVELGSVSDRRASAAAGDDDRRRTYSLGGSFDYRVDEEVEAIVARIVRPGAAAARLAANGAALAEAVGSRGWLGEYLDRVSERWSGRLSPGRRSHSRRHDDSWRWQQFDPETATAAAKSATAPTGPIGEAPTEAAGSRGWLRECADRLAGSAPSFSGRWSARWSQGHRSHRRDDSWRWDPEEAAAAAASRAPHEGEPVLVAMYRWIFGV